MTTKTELEILIALTKAELAAAHELPRLVRGGLYELAPLGAKLRSLEASLKLLVDGAEPGQPEKPAPAAHQIAEQDMPPPRKVAKEGVRKWLLDRRQRHDPKTPYPSREADQKAAEEELGGKIDRDIFRRLRKESLGLRAGRPGANSTERGPFSAPRKPYRRKNMADSKNNSAAARFPAEFNPKSQHPQSPKIRQKKIRRPNLPISTFVLFGRQLPSSTLAAPLLTNNGLGPEHKKEGEGHARGLERAARRLFDGRGNRGGA